MASEDPAAGPVRVLLIDDDATIRTGVTRQLRLQRPHWQVAGAAGGAEALTMLEAAAFDVAVVDIQMPEMDGIATVKALKAASPGLCCLMLTGFADLNAAMESVNAAGAFRFYLKPCPIGTLIDGIEAVLQAAAPARSAKAALGLTALDRLPVGAILASRTGAVVHMNAAAAALIAAGATLRLDSAGVLRGATAAETHRLREALSTAGEEQRSVALALRGGGSGTGLTAAIWPLAGTDKLLVFASAPGSAAAPGAWALATMFGLTPGEARLVHELVAGRSLEESAEKIGISLSSARTYLKTIFGKTGVSRQAELVRLVLSSAASFSGNAEGELRKAV